MKETFRKHDFLAHWLKATKESTRNVISILHKQRLGHVEDTSMKYDSYL